MNEPRARHLMTTDVVTIPPDMPVADIARLLGDHAISAVPVVGEYGELLGLVTEADLVCRLAARLDQPPSWLASFFVSPARAAERYARTHGFTAEDIMTTDIVAVPPNMPASEIAATLERHGIRRVLVVEWDRLQGVVSRRDLLRAIDDAPPGPAIGDVSDDRIRRAVIATMHRLRWAASAQAVVEVHDGVVEFHGITPDRSIQRGLRVLAEQVHGVKGVADRTVILPPDLYSAG
ncbi:MAG TPA: CBS domain-containing protein [Roseomonas sp.]